ncbi:MAG: hypothetical protein R6X08_12325 [Desulfosalsimonadaceae bacterium]
MPTELKARIKQTIPAPTAKLTANEAYLISVSLSVSIYSIVISVFIEYFHDLSIYDYTAPDYP